MIIAHRGYCKNKEENTIPAFEQAFKVEAQGIECDLRITLDNKVVVNHDNNLLLGNKRFTIAKTLLKNLLKECIVNHKQLLTIDELFDYISQKRTPFFLEAKSSSPLLVESIAQKIAEKNLWSQVHIIGFSIFIGTALTLQTKYPKLRVLQLINFPLYSYIKIPAKSYGVFVGWLDAIPGNKWVFKKLISPNRLLKLKEYYQKKGFKVMAGVINNLDGFKYFKDAGIVDIVTDNVIEAITYFEER